MHPQILVAFDFSSASRKALAWAADLQRTLDGSPLQVLHVLHPLPANGPDASGALPVVSPADIARVRRDLASEVEAVTKTAQTDLVVSGAPGAAILETGRRIKADIIVTGTHNRGPLSPFFVGSVAEYVLRHAAVPVITIREPGESAARVA